MKENRLAQNNEILHKTWQVRRMPDYTPSQLQSSRVTLKKLEADLCIEIGNIPTLEAINSTTTGFQMMLYNLPRKQFDSNPWFLPESDSLTSGKNILIRLFVAVPLVLSCFPFAEEEPGCKCSKCVRSFH
ncbi:hypothetical protein T07_13192 [Trichinella nelsoni]|uniref:Uncharacterized protein n=1 Tax=Trichinella nelsoni TaxID=6336 RepID=A0A0V0RTX8_9BILA|nr:hypothetical protein T07_13192 [Trichinella nelsoni]